MQFLRTLFWVILAVFLAVLASRNWHDVTIKLWGDILVDIKLPVLVALVFLLGFLPTFLVLRARLWAVRRKLDTQERQRRATTDTPAEPTQAQETAA